MDGCRPWLAYYLSGISHQQAMIRYMLRYLTIQMNRYAHFGYGNETLWVKGEPLIYQ
ncbi:hypothetical protein SAMN04488688_105124 [Paenibacillus sp. cl141a]|nr:hypothetical protein SAMN04488688_105124 [Paenibacillus sp. cl141a]